MKEKKEYDTISQNSGFTPVKIKNSISIEKQNSSLNNKKSIISEKFLQFINIMQFYISKIKEYKIIQIIINNLFNIICFLLIFISIIYYLLCLESCGTTSPNICLKQRGREWYIKIAYNTLKSSFFYSNYLNLLFFNCKGFIHLIYSIPIYLYFFIKYQGSDTIDHGYYNSFGFIIFALLYIPLSQLLIHTIYNLYKRKWKKFFFLSIIIITLNIIIYNFLNPKNDCDGTWVYGLNNTKIDNDDKYPCKIEIPKTCGQNIYSWYMDVTKFIRPTCNLKRILKNEKMKFMNVIKNAKYFDKKYNHFGYPITCNVDIFDIEQVLKNEEMNSRYFVKLIRNNIIMMDKFNNKNYPNTFPPEVELKFDKDNIGHITQKINFNKTLSEERKEIAKNKKSLFNNVLIIYEDALSKKHFLRKLPKTSKLIEQYMYYNKDINEKPISSFQFFKYHNLGKFTVKNVIPMFNGQYEDDKNENKSNFIKYYKENGFVTAQSSLWCSRETYDPGDFRAGKNSYIGYDHENNALFCDPNCYEPGYSYLHGVNSILKRCLYGNSSFIYALEYAELFWDAYKDNKKLFKMSLAEAHEFTLELISHSDDHLYNFVQKFIDKGYLNDTIVFFLSDHGNNFRGYLKIKTTSDDRKIEGLMGVLFIMLPNKKEIYESSMYNNLIINSQVFITPFDIYNTLIFIALNDFNNIISNGTYIYDKNIYSRRGESIFNYIDYNQRYCESPKLDLNISAKLCKCIKK